MPKHTFEDVKATVAAMIGRRPNRTNDNLLLTRQLTERLGLTSVLDKIKFVHVAGTKGKGTTCAFTSKLLQNAYNYRVGLFISPHLFDIRERIQINNEMLTHDKFTEYFFDIHDKIEEIKNSSEINLDVDGESQCTRSNFFRFMFLVGLHAFHQQECDVAVLEVGIGGRHDSTNIVPHPIACGISALGLDHMELLGDTVQLIAREKAGIMKKGCMCFSVSQTMHLETRNVLEEESKLIGAPLVILDPLIMPISQWPPLMMTGEHFIENSKLALALARTVAGRPITEPLNKKEINALMSTRLEGRSQIIRLDNYTFSSDSQIKLPPNMTLKLFFDGAHNAESMEVMTKWFFVTELEKYLLEARKQQQQKSAKKIIKATVAFYCTREPKNILKYFMPYIKYIDKIIFCLISNPKQTTLREASEEDKKGNIKYATEWRRLYPEVPSHQCGSPFHHLENCLEVMLSTPGKTENNVGGNADEIGVTADMVKLQHQKTILKTTTTTPITTTASSSNGSLQKMLNEEADVAIANHHHPQFDGDITITYNVEHWILFTGSILFVGDTLQLVHDAGY